jgi:hypothetical protein
MYNVQTIPTHNKKTHFQPKFSKNNMDNKIIRHQTKIEKINLTF